MEGIVVQLSVAVSNQPFFFLQLPVHVDTGDETMVVHGVEGNADLLVERVVAGEGGKVHGISDQWGGVGSHEGSGSKRPPVVDAIHVMAVGMHIVMVIDIVMVESDVVGVALPSILKGEFLAILDMVFTAAVVHNKPLQFVGYTLFVLAVGGLVGKHRGDLS